MNLNFTNIRRAVVYGSLAYDRVMFYGGRFRDALLPDKLHIINVSFAVPSIKENFGGTAGNIAYSLALLKVPVQVRSSVGEDAKPYRIWLHNNHIELRLQTVDSAKTAAAYITTDEDDNQITAFHAGALAKPMPGNYFNLQKGDLVVVAPGNCADMVKLSKQSRKSVVPYIFDPGQQVPAFSQRELAACVKGASVLIGNDYELSLMARRLGVSELSLRQMVPLFVRTLGPRGSELCKGGRCIKVRSAKARVVDPTGAGDAYRAGLLYGLLHGFSLEQAGRCASVAAAYTVEKYGTQTHTFSVQLFKARYKSAFKEGLPA